MDYNEKAELVWTGPPNVALATRTTYSVVRDLFRRAREEIIVVGYALTVGADRAISEFAAAGARGVHLTLVGQRLDDMIGPLKSMWPVGQGYPEFFSYDPTAPDSHAALHAKVVITDRREILVTSANLTYHGFHANIEIGVLCRGKVAEDGRQLLLSLIDAGTLRRVSVAQ